MFLRFLLKGEEQRASAAPPARTSCYCWFTSLARISARVLLRLHKQPKHRCYLLLVFFSRGPASGCCHLRTTMAHIVPKVVSTWNNKASCAANSCTQRQQVQGPDFSLIQRFCVQMPLWEHKSAHRHMKALVQTKLVQNQSKTSE
jgi:hypothetical protein